MTSHGSREDVRAFNAELVRAYWDGESVASIAKRSGRDRSTINKLIEADISANGLRERKAKPADPRILANKKVLTDRHGSIGLKIALYRATHNLTPTQFGMLISASRTVVRNMEIGAHDFTLCEIDRLAVVLGSAFDQLIHGVK